MRAKELLLSALFLGGMAGYAWSAMPRDVGEPAFGSAELGEPRREFKSFKPPYYPNCDSARAAGTAPLYAGEPGYRAPLDADGDGIACGPYRRR